MFQLLLNIVNRALCTWRWGGSMDCKSGYLGFVFLVLSLICCMNRRRVINLAVRHLPLCETRRDTLLPL